MFPMFALLLRKALEVGAYLVTHVAESGQALLLSSLDDGRICEAMMQACCGTEKYWTAFLRVGADDQHIIECCPLHSSTCFDRQFILGGRGGEQRGALGGRQPAATRQGPWGSRFPPPTLCASGFRCRLTEREAVAPNSE